MSLTSPVSETPVAWRYRRKGCGEWIVQALPVARFDGDQLEVEPLYAVSSDAYSYARELLVSFVNEHCDPVPQWKPNDDLMGILMQFDNALTVVRSIKAGFDPKHPRDLAPRSWTPDRDAIYRAIENNVRSVPDENFIDRRWMVGINDAIDAILALADTSTHQSAPERNPPHNSGERLPRVTRQCRGLIPAKENENGNF